MKIAILGTRGIPNYYGGFEQCAEYLALGLVNKGYEVTVYNSHTHPYTAAEWKGVNIIHCTDPEDKLGAIGQFIYDFNCISNSRKRDFDVILQLGYTSSSIWGWMLPTKPVITTNMDGLEWKRTKFSEPVRKFILYAEKLATQYSDFFIADSIGIQNYLKEKYDKESTYIPYGAYIFNNTSTSVLKEYAVEPFGYNILIARLEPENSIEIILDGFVQSKSKMPLLVVGKHETKYGRYLKLKFKNENIIFTGGIYNMDALNNLRYHSNIYFHGHTVGGTNPSLIEAMASNSLICAHDNPFNRYILEDDCYYFLNSDDIEQAINNIRKNDTQNEKKIVNNRSKVEELYSWERIVNLYVEHFESIVKFKS